MTDAEVVAEISLTVGNPTSHGIFFSSDIGEEILRIEADGSIYHRGEKIEDDRRVYEGLCDLLNIEPK